MKYCPQCQSEYFDDIKRCEDCEVPLIGESEMKAIQASQEMEAQEVFVKIATLENQFEADTFKDALEKEKIPVMIRTFHDTAYNGIYIPQKGWGIILVPQEYKAKAQSIILNLKNTLEK